MGDFYGTFCYTNSSEATACAQHRKNPLVSGHPFTIYSRKEGNEWYEALPAELLWKC